MSHTEIYIAIELYTLHGKKHGLINNTEMYY